MKKAFLYSLALLAVVMGFVACSDDDDNYTPAKVSGPQVFFNNEISKTVNLSGEVTSFTIPVSRYNDAEAVTVNIAKIDTAGLFNVPTSISFAPGEKEASLQIGYDPAKFEFNDAKGLVLAIDKSSATPYGNDTLKLSVVMPMTWKSLGKGTYVDNWAGYSGAVEVLQCEQQPANFRLVKPYAGFDGGEDFVMEGEMDPYLAFTLLQKGDKIGDVEIAQEGLVYFPVYYTGMIIPDYGVNIEIDHPSEFSKLRNEESWLFNKVVEYQENGLPAQVQFAPYYYMEGLGGWNNTQSDGVIEFYFPGNAPLDYEMTVEYMGKNVSPNDVYTAIFDLTAGSDLDEVKYALVSGNDAEAILNGILDGSVESETIDASTTITIPMEKAGTYTFMAVGFAEGEVQAYDYETILFEMGGGETWKAVAHGVYTYGVEVLTDNAGSAYDGQQNGILYQSSLDETRYRILPWAHWSSDGLIFSWNKDTNVIKANAVDTGENYIEEGEDYGRILFSDLTSYDESLADYTSSYNPETKTFEFLGTYHFGQYWMGAVIETFVVDDELNVEEPAASRGMKHGAVRNQTGKKNAKFAAARLEKELK